jgi:hypothetical protein
LPQNRLPSGTWGSVRIAAAGSPFGMRGISTIPAPRRPRLLDIVDDPVRAVRTDAVARLGAVEVEGADAGAVEVETACGAAGPGALPQTSQ